jgi:tellurite resistance protein TerC
MVAPLSRHQRVPWPSALRPVMSRFDPILGPQRVAALKVGLLGAYAGRILMLFLASIVIQNKWMQIVGAIYLIYLAIKHFGEEFRHPDASEEDDQIVPRERRGFWSTVVTIELADLAFSLDNVVAAVALSNRLWVVILGVAIGIVVMRFAATIFTRLIAWEPALEAAAYLLLLAIGGELLLDHYLHIDFGEWGKFAISIAIIVLVVLFARVRLLRSVWIVFRPFLALFALINDGLSYVFGLLAAPFRGRGPKVIDPTQ